MLKLLFADILVCSSCSSSCASSCCDINDDDDGCASSCCDIDDDDDVDVDVDDDEYNDLIDARYSSFFFLFSSICGVTWAIVSATDAFTPQVRTADSTGKF